jgi:hypothetical protein
VLIKTIRALRTLEISQVFTDVASLMAVDTHHRILIFGLAYLAVCYTSPVIQVVQGVNAKDTVLICRLVAKRTIGMAIFALVCEGIVPEAARTGGEALSILVEVT